MKSGSSALVFDRKDFSCHMAESLVGGIIRLICMKIGGCSMHAPIWKDNSVEIMTSPRMTPEWEVSARAQIPVIGTCLEAPSLARALWRPGLVDDVRNDIEKRLAAIREMAEADIRWNGYLEIVSSLQESPWWLNQGSIASRCRVDPVRDNFSFSVYTALKEGLNVIWDWHANVSWMRTLDMGEEMLAFSREFLSQERKRTPGLRIIG